MNRTVTVLAATVAAFLLAAAPAAAETLPDPLEDCVGVECVTPADEVDEWALDTPTEEPDDVTTEDEVACLVVVADGCDSIGDPVTGASWDESGYEDEAPVVVPTPEPEPVVVGDGDWGWSDARESYTA